MFTKQPRPGQPNYLDDKSTATIDRIHPVGVEAMPNFDPPTIQNGSVIGADLTILGENINIVSKEALQIDGEIHGDVTGQKILIGAGGRVVGTISAAVVEIDGGVEGTVRALEVRLNADARVSGDLVHQTLVISEGAEFEGSVRRSKDASELKPNLEIASPPARIPVTDTSPSSPEPSPEFHPQPEAVKPLEKPALQIDG